MFYSLLVFKTRKMLTLHYGPVFKKVNQKVNLRRHPTSVCLPGHHYFKGQIFEKPFQKLAAVYAEIHTAG